VMMITSPDLPPRIASLIARGCNPLALVREVSVAAPFRELVVARACADQAHCATCIGPGPFSSEGQCIPCVQKEQHSEPTVASVVRDSTFAY